MTLKYGRPDEVEDGVSHRPCEARQALEPWDSGKVSEVVNSGMLDGPWKVPEEEMCLS